MSINKINESTEDDIAQSLDQLIVDIKEVIGEENDPSDFDTKVKYIDNKLQREIGVVNGVLQEYYSLLNQYYHNIKNIQNRNQNSNSNKCTFSNSNGKLEKY